MVSAAGALSLQEKKIGAWSVAVALGHEAVQHPKRTVRNCK